MAYLGTPPQSGFITTAKQRVTSSTNDYVDLDHSISSIADVIVFVNFVKQDTTNLTLTTSTRITLGGTLVSSDIVEIHYLGKAVNTQTPGTATVTNDMLAGSIANSKLANSSITLNGSAVSLGGSATVGVDNTPAFFAYSPQSYQAISSSTWTAINTTNESFDTANAFDTSTLKFTPQVAGKYFLYGNAVTDGNWSGNLARLRISKNNNSGAGGDELRNHIAAYTDDGVHVSGMLTLNGSSDFVQLAIYHEIGSSYNLKNQMTCNFFGGFLVTTT